MEIDSLTEAPPASGGASMFLDALYLSAGAILIPYFLWRRWILKKNSAGLGKKLGQIATRAGGVPRIWVHAVSVGEAAAAEPLVKSLRQSIHGSEVVVSTTTVTGQEVALKRYGAENTFYYPLDLSFAVKRTLDRVKPSVIVLMELEIWPNLTAEAAKRNIPIVVVNGRVTERAARRYKRFWMWVGPAFQRVRRWLVQSDEYALRLKELGVAPGRIQVSGNIKYDALDQPPNPAERSALRAALGIPDDATVLAGGSTHPTEELALLAAYRSLREKICPALRLIIVPRHPEKCPAVADAIRTAGFTVVKWTSMPSKGGSGFDGQSVLLVDAVGVLKNIYKIADVAFVGGSLIPHGGQNVMEPCGLGIPVLHGPHMHNFNDAMQILRGCKGSVEVTRENFTGELEKILGDMPAAREMAARARESFMRHQGATDRAVAYIRRLIPDSSKAPQAGPDEKSKLTSARFS